MQLTWFASRTSFSFLALWLSVFLKRHTRLFIEPAMAAEMLEKEFLCDIKIYFHSIKINLYSIKYIYMIPKYVFIQSKSISVQYTIFI